MAGTTRVIKRYGNRKMYDVEGSAYVSLEEIAALIRSGATVQVVDNVTGEDITAQTLTLVVLEEGKRGKGVLSTGLLHDLVRRGGDVIDASVGQLRHGVDGLVQGSIGRIARAVQGPRAEELQQLRQQLTHLESTIGQLLEREQGADAAPPARGARRAATKGARPAPRKKR